VRIFGLDFFIKLFLEAPLDNRKKNFAKISIFFEILEFKGCLAMSASKLSKFDGKKNQTENSHARLG
jgi:hypothetical protein